MTVVTIYALFFDDIRLIAFAKSKDDISYGFTLGSMIMFFCEIIMNTYALPKYFNSFFFWLDLVSTLSMIPDCGWIWNAMIDNTSGDGGGGGDSAADLAKNSRAGRITRVIRIIRLIRLIRIVKLYKQQQIAKVKAFQYSNIKHRKLAKMQGILKKQRTKMMAAAN